MEFNDNPRRQVYCIDIDGTLTNGELFWEKEPTPDKEAIERLRNLYRAGNIIIIHTARQWECANETVAWLIKNKVPFHGLYMAKGGADVYVDNRAMGGVPDSEGL